MFRFWFRNSPKMFLKWFLLVGIRSNIPKWFLKKPLHAPRMCSFFIFYFNCLWCTLMQQVYMYFRGSGKAAQMKHDAARGVMRAAIWISAPDVEIDLRVDRGYGYDTRSTVCLRDLFSCFRYLLGVLLGDFWETAAAFSVLWNWNDGYLCILVLEFTAVPVYDFVS